VVPIMLLKEVSSSVFPICSSEQCVCVCRAFLEAERVSTICVSSMCVFVILLYRDDSFLRSRVCVFQRRLHARCIVVKHEPSAHADST